MWVEDGVRTSKQVPHFAYFPLYFSVLFHANSWNTIYHSLNDGFQHKSLKIV